MAGYPTTQTQTFPLLGGLDIETAQFSRIPGMVMGGGNYESSAETGYESIGGFERFDGRARPSDATYKVLAPATVFSGVVAGDVITGQTSGTTAIVLRIVNGELICTRSTGLFAPNETLKVSGNSIGIFQRESDAVTSFDDNVYSALAADNYRASIGLVPGSGPMRGLAALGSTIYAFRDNAGATALTIYKSSAAGWVLVPLMQELAFTAGSGAVPAEGSTITKGAVSAIVRRVVVTSNTGDWTGSAIAGRLIIDTVIGGAFTAGAFTAGITATCSGANAQITLLPGGRLDSVNYNFTGSTATERIYGCDGVNAAWEFDGTCLVPIRTGMTVDTPRHIACHRNSLFLAYGASVQVSAISKPYAWTVVLGAAEIATGQEITGFSNLPGEVDSAPLMVYSLNRTTVIYGTSSADWRVMTYSTAIGAQRWSVQNMGNPIVFNSLGITPVEQTQEFGNFISTSTSSRIRSYLEGKTISSSVVNRNKTRMRMFFTDGSGVSITPIGNIMRFMPMTYNLIVRVALDAAINGVLRNFFASDDGYVYEADVGRSFDGKSIVSWLKLAFNHAGSTMIKKRFKKLDIELRAKSAATLAIQGEYSLGAMDIGQTAIVQYSMAGFGGRYDVTNWDQCFYDSPDQTLAEMRIDGVGTNLSTTFISESNNQLTHTLQSVTTSFITRRLQR